MKIYLRKYTSHDEYITLYNEKDWPHILELRDYNVIAKLLLYLGYKIIEVDNIDVFIELEVWSNEGSREQPK